MEKMIKFIKNIRDWVTKRFLQKISAYPPHLFPDVFLHGKGRFSPGARITICYFFVTLGSHL